MFLKDCLICLKFNTQSSYFAILLLLQEVDKLGQSRVNPGKKRHLPLLALLPAAFSSIFQQRAEDTKSHNFRLAQVMGKAKLDLA